MKKLLVFLVTGLMFGSCGRVKNGEHTEYYENGKVSSWGLYEDGKELHIKYYDTSGQITTEVTSAILEHINGEKLEYPILQKNWHSNGLIARVIENNLPNQNTLLGSGAEGNDMAKEGSDNPIKYQVSFDALGRKSGKWIWMCGQDYNCMRNYDKNDVTKSGCKHIDDEDVFYNWKSSDELGISELPCEESEDIKNIIKEQAVMILKNVF